MSIAIALTLALAAAPASAAGFSAADLEAAARPAMENRAELRVRLADASENLRLAFALDPAAAMAAASPEEAALLKAALGMGDAHGDLRARWFMAGAIGRVYGGSLTTTLYNPLARGWLVLDWRAAEGKWTIAAARVTSAGPSDWTAKDGPWLGNFVADYAAIQTDVRDRTGDTAGLEADKWIAGAAAILSGPGRRSAADAARAMIVEGKTAKFGGSVIDAIPPRARATWWPIAGFERLGGEASLIFGSALFPQMLIAADFGSGAAPSLMNVTLVNLANAGAEK